MPTRPASPCRSPGCRRLVPSGGYCPEHRHLAPSRLYDASKRRTDPALALAARIRNSPQWRRLSRLVRSEEPLCRDPFGLHAKSPAISEHVHHIVGLTTAPSLAYARENLAGVCTRCHSRLEALERAGKATSGLFSKTGGITPRSEAGSQATGGGGQKSETVDINTERAPICTRPQVLGMGV